MDQTCEAEMPNLFVIGAAKCGTTSLHRYLDLHPEISMSTIKEPMYFLPKRDRLTWTHSPVVNSEEEYLALFEGGTKVRGEASTMYTAYPRHQGVAARIHAAAPDAKLVYLVRDPIERARAFWTQWMSVRGEFNRDPDGPMPFEQHIGDLESPENLYIWPGMYMTQLRQFLEFFPEESILVVDSDELRLDRGATLRSVFEFLEVEPSFSHQGFSEALNTIETKRVESGVYIRLTRCSLLRRFVDMLPSRVREDAVEMVRGPLMVPTGKPDIAPELRVRLEDLFRPEVDELRRFSGKDFPGWSV